MSRSRELCGGGLCPGDGGGCWCVVVDEECVAGVDGVEPGDVQRCQWLPVWEVVVPLLGLGVPA